MSEKPAVYFNSGDKDNPEFSNLKSTPIPPLPLNYDFFMGNNSTLLLS